MIRLGLSPARQQAVLDAYLVAHSDMTRVVLFTPDAFPCALTVPASLTCQRFSYTDIILYQVFYPLLEVIDTHTLLVFHQCLRTRNRNDLTYNCAHHYARQTPHVLIFEAFPFIERAEDLLILLDLQTPGKYKGRGWDVGYLADEDVRGVAPRLCVEALPVPITDAARARYTAKKDALFAGLGAGDPESIPRQLSLWVGTLKRPALASDRHYVARNDRFHLSNVTPYRQVGVGAADAAETVREDRERDDLTFIDLPHRRLDMNDLLARTGLRTVRFLTTGLPVDEYYLSEMRAWVARVGAMYDAINDQCDQ